MEWRQLTKDEKVALVLKLWKTGDTASILSKKISQYSGTRVSRQAVLGVYYRNSSELKDAPLGEDRRPATSRHYEYPRSPEHIAFDQASLRLPLEALNRNQCHWPVENPDPDTATPFLFCGHPVTSRSRYCSHHQMRSSVPMRMDSQDEE